MRSLRLWVQGHPLGLERGRTALRLDGMWNANATHKITMSAPPLKKPRNARPSSPVLKP